MGSQFPLKEHKSPPPQGSRKITQKLQFGPPRASGPVLKITKKLLKISYFSEIFRTGPGWAKLQFLSNFPGFLGGGILCSLRGKWACNLVKKGVFINRCCPGYRKDRLPEKGPFVIRMSVLALFHWTRPEVHAQKHDGGSGEIANFSSFLMGLDLRVLVRVLAWRLHAHVHLRVCLVCALCVHCVCVCVRVCHVHLRVCLVCALCVCVCGCVCVCACVCIVCIVLFVCLCVCACVFKCACTSVLMHVAS